MIITNKKIIYFLMHRRGGKICVVLTLEKEGVGLLKILAGKLVMVFRYIFGMIVGWVVLLCVRGSRASSLFLLKRMAF
jgi:hypothetical protein